MRDNEIDSIDRDSADAAPVATPLCAGPGSDISLMALDAAIAAVRFRPAGKPFSAVAGEIKDLAIQTAEVAGDAALRHSGLPEGRATG